ncbi:hypothetical protein GPJ56_010862 [Histomonas meleagridis]|uniref:uncharacterized protein n=1 Tax=Histomonas meleagridis TaxID=135588 RepID=UPI003559A45A|nr:hypothetical protein GPJ56_010862 [Histomonas meleagridis]KAH0803716.1 hypothetical protein GO595_003490 [Histomonas meleagridis]
MSTIPNQKPIVRTKNEDFSLRTDDIDGAQYKPDSRFQHDFVLNISDIEGTKPITHIDKSKAPVDIMNVNDIEGAQPRICRNLPHSKRHTNPLNPEYQLPTKKEEPPPVTKFVYDGFNFDDIPGVHPKSYKPTKPARDIMKVDDIAGARPKFENRRFDTSNRILDVSDINADGMFKTKRHTNPLNPEYNYDGHILENDFGVSHTNYLSRNDNIDLSLTVNDINGASADSSTQWIRSYRMPKEEADDEDNDRNVQTSLILPSMIKETAILERKKAIDKMRGERIRKFENRHLETVSHTDKVQAALRKKRNSETKPRATFSVSPITM